MLLGCTEPLDSGIRVSQWHEATTGGPTSAHRVHNGSFQGGWYTVGNTHWLLLPLISWLLCHWVERPTGVPTSHSFSMASALGICQIPVSRLWPFPDRAKFWPLAQSPRVKPECEAGLPRIHGLPLSPVHPGSLNIPFWWVSKLQDRRQSWSLSS